MWLSFYNKEGISDTLLLTSGNADRYNIAVVTKQGVTQITDTTTGDVVGYNLHNASQVVTFDHNGQQFLTEAQQEAVKAQIQAAGFDGESLDLAPKDTLVVGYVESCVPHEDSDHLNVTQTRVNDDTVLQIVCGAPNIKAGQKVVVATPGTVMPNGAIIWAGELRGVKSYGMICSARELGLPNAPAKKGILVLDDDAVVGSPFKG